MSACRNWSARTMEQTAQRQYRWLAVCASIAILHGAFLVSGPVAAEDTAAVPEVLTLKEAAEFLHVDPLVLKDMARRQAIPGRRIGVYWRFSRSALVAWLAGPENTYVSGQNIAIDGGFTRV